jgi:hypothetical protein
VIFLTGFLLAIFVFPDGWEVPVIIGFALLEIAETAITWRFSRIWAPMVGSETLIEAPAGPSRIAGQAERCAFGARNGRPAAMPA